MGVLRDESFTYNGTVVGNPTGTYPTEIGDRFAFRIDQDRCYFECKFVLRATGASDMAAKATALEALLRQRYAKLTVTWGATTQEVFDPALTGGNASTGWDGEPLVEKDNDFPHSALARGYVFRVQIALPPNYTDAYGAAAGRRTIDVNLHYDVTERRVVTITGVWTQVPASYARAQFLAQIQAFAAYRLNIIDPTATWTVTRREESDPNSQSTLTFTRELSEHVNGRRISRVEIRTLPSRLLEVVVTGTYLRTITGSNYGTGATSSANYGDGTTGGIAYAEGTQIPAITNARGTPLNVGTNCQRTSADVITNEQDDRTDYTLTFREINFKQSGTANVLDDPDVVLDTIVFECSFDPVNDSIPSPSASGTVGVISDGSVAGLLGNGGVANGAPSQTGSSGVGAGPGGAPSSQQQLGVGNGGASGGGVAKPVLLRIRYECTVNKALVGEAAMRAKWEGDLLPYLLSTLTAQLGIPPLTLIRQSPSFDAQNNRIAADIVAQGFPNDLIAYRLAESVQTFWGVRLSRVYNGKPYAYVVQQGLPRQVKVRTLSAVYRTNGAFGGLAPLGSKTQIPGFVLLDVSKPDRVSSRVGIVSQQGNTLALVDLTSEIMVETLEYVGSQVNQAVT